MPAARLELRGLGKSFGPTAALSDVDLDLGAGELHVLAGENGAGKSTLIRILSGVYPDYRGEIRLDGRPIRLRSPAAAARAGIATIHQELSLVGTLSVTDNFLISEREGAFRRVHRQTARERAERALGSLELAVDPDTPVEELSLADRQLVEIARALTLARKAEVLILDEPTSALSAADSERLFARLEVIRQSGTSLFYISHRMDEIFRLADRITVLRDGRVVLARTRSETSADEVVFALLGRKPEAAKRGAPRVGSEALLHVRALSAPPGLGTVAFDVRPGEILGIAGLGGSGAQTLLSALFGATACERAEMTLKGERYAPRTPREAVAAGVLLVPGDRGLGVFGDLDGVQNATLASLRRYVRSGFLDPQRERADVEREAARFELRSSSLAAPASSLSGGNQQKLVLMRCLLAEPRLLLLDDPTRGVDVGAKHDVHRALRELAGAGISVVFFSSEIDELGAVCDRVLGFNRGAIAVEMTAAEFDRERLLAALMGSAA